MPSSTIENYAKNIYLLAQEGERKQVPMGEVARALGVVPGTATTMVKSLARHGYADYEPRAGVSLNARGNALALQVLRRHRLVETFLVQTLGMDWSEIHEEAEALEHAISDRMLHRLDAFLGHPQYDPHGDPIPDAQGHIPPRKLRPLSECSTGTQTRIRRILDQEEAFLRFMQDNGLVPGASIIVRQFNASAQCLEVEVLGNAEGKSHSTHAAQAAERGNPAIVSLGQQAAAKVMVE